MPRRIELRFFDMLSLWRDRKRKRYAAASVLLALLFVFAGWSALSSDGAYVPDESLNAADPERSQVYYGGSGYSIDLDVKQEHDEAQEERSKILQERRESHQETKAQKRMSETREQAEPKEAAPSDAPSPTPKQTQNGTPKASSNAPPDSRPAATPKQAQSSTPVQGKPVSKPKSTTPSQKKQKPKEAKDPEKPGKKKDEDDTVAKESNKLPTIKTSLIDGRKMKGSPVNFWVKATDYKKQNIPVFSNDEGHFEVYLNGEQITSTGSSKGKTSFRADVINGANTIKIIATDKRNKQAKLTVKIRCNTEEPSKIVGSVYVSASAPSLGIGTIFSEQKVEITEQMPLNEILKAAFKEQGISSEMSSNYLAALKKDGIAKDAEITDELRERAQEYRVTLYEREDWPDGWKNRLKEKDFCSSSGWVYYVNGDMPDVGIGSFIPEDGDEIELVFQLFDGDMD